MGTSGTPLITLTLRLSLRQKPCNHKLFRQRPPHFFGRLFLCYGLWIWLLAGASASATLLSAQEAPKISRSLTLEDVLRLSKAGVNDELIIAQVKRNARAFDLNTDEIIELKNSGVSDAVIKYLLDPSLPYAPPTVPAPILAAPTPASPPVPTKAPSDPIAMKVPADPGIYYYSASHEFIRLDLKSVIPAKQPGKLRSTLSGGLLKGHIIGTVIGAAARTRVERGNATFYVRLADKSTIDDFTLLRLERSESRRNLDFGIKAGASVFPVDSIGQFESLEVAPSIFRVLAPLKTTGEYAFFILGSADEKRGFLGKAYDFGADSATHH